MFDASDLEGAERLIGEWRGALEERTSRAKALAARLAELTATARSPDGLVTVTVGARGDLTALDLAEGVRHQPATVTAREIVATLRAARGAMAATVTAVTVETAGADSATGRAVVETYANRLALDDGDGDAMGGDRLPAS